MTAIVVHGKTILVPRAWTAFTVNGSLFTRFDYDGAIYNEQASRRVKTWAA